MSQIHYQYESTTIKEVLEKFNGSIVVVKREKIEKIYFEVMFPKKTHYLKKEATVYKEFVDLYTVIKVIRSKELKVNDQFWLWFKPNYDYQDTKEYHERGLSISPIILKRKSQFPILEDTRILFIKKYKEEKFQGKSVYYFYTEEGVEAEKEILSIIK